MSGQDDDSKVSAEGFDWDSLHFEVAPDWLPYRGPERRAAKEAERAAKAEARARWLRQRERMVSLAIESQEALSLGPPLEANPVPGSAWMANLRYVLRPSDWQAISKAVREAAGNVCRVCGGAGTQHATEAHEVFTWNEETEVARLEGVVALCPLCHAVQHPGHAFARGWEDEVIQHLAQVNKWTRKHADRHISESAVLWLARSSIPWAFDLSALEIEITDEMREDAQRRQMAAFRKMDARAGKTASPPLVQPPPD